MENDMVITSPSNERLKHARRVRDGREPDLMFVEGAHLVEECLRSGLKLRACFHEPDPTPRAQGLIDEMASRGCPLYPAIRWALETVGDTVNTQGLIVIAERPEFNLIRALQESWRRKGRSTRLRRRRYAVRWGRLSDCPS
jgi:TrmH family RNA methyltransferase